MKTYKFPDLTSYGNYTVDLKLPKRITRLPLNGTIRIANKLNIPSVKIVHYIQYDPYPTLVGYAIPTKYVHLINEYRTKQAQKNTPAPHPDLILCIREMSRSAHRERDAAEEAYQERRHSNAGKHKLLKVRYYALKDRGIAEAYRRGLLRFAGVAPQNMGVYEYGDGGMSCFHSTLMPAGAERVPVEGHPETLLVPATDKQKGISLARVIATLEACPHVDADAFERVPAPAIKKQEPTCFLCGGLGHLSYECTKSDDEQESEEMVDAYA